MNTAKAIFNFSKKSLIQSINKNLVKKSLFATSLSYIFFKSKKDYSNKLSLQEEFVKHLLSGYENLEEGQMREFKYGSGKTDSVLIVKYEGKLRAVSNYCTHFGAPLHTGVLIDRVVKCPWHAASFDVVTGKADISPGLNDLATFEVVQEGDKYYVKLPANIADLKHSKVPDMIKRDKSNTTRYIIIGGGPAGLSTAETLRQTGFTGEILIISSDEHLPYDRAMLTKWVPPSSDQIHLRGPKFYQENDIEVKLNSTVNKVDQLNKKVTLSDGQQISYEKLMVASGSSAVIPKINGFSEKLKNIYTIRSFNDAKTYIDAVKDKKNIVILGGGFISLEAASIIKKTNKDANVTVLVNAKSPFFKELGDQVGSVLRQLHEQNGVKIITEVEVESVSSSNDHVNKLNLNNNTSVNCDMVVLGKGASPNTSFLKDVVNFDGNYIKANIFMKTSDQSIFCAGDVASVPFIHTGKRYSYGHYVSAQQQGAIGALNMLDKNVPYDYVPYYWTRMWDKTLQFTGNGENFDEVFVDGDLSQYKFVAYYFKQGELVGCASMGVDNAVNIMYEVFKSNLRPRASLIKDGTVTLENLKDSVGKVRNKCSRSTCACFPKSNINI